MGEGEFKKETGCRWREIEGETTENRLESGVLTALMMLLDYTG